MPKASTIKAKEGTKAQLLEAGARIMTEKGYNHTGILEILQETGVPKGSFYYYFASKEDFGLRIIDDFAEAYSQTLDEYFKDTSLSPLNRLRKYCEDGRKKFEAQECRKGCLIGNLSQEMSDQSEIMRVRLEEVMNGWRDRFADCLKEAQKQNEIPARYDAKALAEFFLSGWEGAVMRSKVTKSTKPIDTFIKMVFEKLFVP